MEGAPDLLDSFFLFSMIATEELLHMLFAKQRSFIVVGQLNDSLVSQPITPQTRVAEALATSPLKRRYVADVLLEIHSLFRMYYLFHTYMS